MKKVTVILAMLALMISTNLFAQTNYFNQIDKAEKVYEKSLKWDKFKIPGFFEGNYIFWREYLLFEGKATRYQYMADPDNNPSYVLKVYTKDLTDKGFTIMYSADDEQLGLSSGKFSSNYNKKLKNEKLGFKYGIGGGRNSSLIIAKKKEEKNTIYVVIFTVSFDDGTIITEDIFEPESIKEYRDAVSLYKGSKIEYSDDIGFNEFIVVTNVDDKGVATTKNIKGIGKHVFCEVPEASTFQLIENYKEAIQAKDGKILALKKGKSLYKYFAKLRPDHGLTNYSWLSWNW